MLVCKSYGEINKVNSKIEVSSYFATPPIPPPPTPRIRILKIDQKKAGFLVKVLDLSKILTKKKPTIYSRDLQNSYSSGDVGLVHSIYNFPFNVNLNISPYNFNHTPK